MVRALYLSLVCLAAVVGMVAAFLTWLRRDEPGAGSLTLFVTAASFWAIADGFALASDGLEWLRFWRQIAFTVSTVIPLAWLVTVVEYTGRARWLDRQRLGLLLVEPFLFTVLVWTNGNGHRLVWTAEASAAGDGFTSFAMQFGIGFWAHQVYTYLLVTAGALVLAGMILRTNEIYRSQGTALLGAIALPMIGNALYVFRVTPPGIDPTGLGYVLAGVVVVVAMFRGELLSLTPVTRKLGREEVVDEMDDCVVIVDEADRIVDANPAAEELFDRPRSQVLGESLPVAVPEVRPVLDGDEESGELGLERRGHYRYYDVRVSELYRRYGVLSGRLVSLRDVTKRHQREERLDVLNRLLRHNIRNEMNVVRGNAELAASRSDDSAVVDRLDRIVENADAVIDRSEKVGVLARSLDAADARPVDLAAQLEEQCDRIARSRPEASIVTDVREECWVEAGPSLSVVWTELLTNAIEHNEGDPSVTVRIDEDAGDEQSVVAEVADDGPGLREQEWRSIVEGRETPLQHGSGIGLWMVHWVTRRFGGSVSFENTDEGCTIRVHLPRADPPADPGDRSSTADGGCGESTGGSPAEDGS